MPQTPPTIRWVEEFALSTDGWIKAFPLGEYKRRDKNTGQMRTLKLTNDKIKQMEKNFKNDFVNYDLPINVEHEATAGRIGVIKDMEARKDGLYVLPDEEALAVLKAKRFGYVSPEIYWEGYENNKGEAAENVVVGLAATNTPYFGREVALFSAKENFMMVDGMESSAYYWLGLLDSLTRAVSGTESNDPARSALEAAKEAVKRKTTGLISEYSGGKMPEKEEFAAGDLEGDLNEFAKAWKTLKRFFKPEGEAEPDGDDKKTDDDKVSGDKKEKASAVTGVDVAQFNALKTQLEAQYAEQFAAVKAENERLAAAVAAEQHRAELGVMDKFSERFVFSRVDKFSEHLVTWKTKLGAEEFAVLSDVLDKANEAVKAGGLFSRRSTGESVERGPAEEFDAKVRQHMEKFNTDYGTAVEAVGRLHADLYAKSQGR